MADVATKLAELVTIDVLPV